MHFHCKISVLFWLFVFVLVGMVTKMQRVGMTGWKRIHVVNVVSGRNVDLIEGISFNGEIFRWQNEMM